LNSDRFLPPFRINKAYDAQQKTSVVSDTIPVEPLPEIDSMQPCSRCGEMTARKLLPSFNAIILQGMSGGVVRVNQPPPMAICEDCWKARPLTVRICHECKMWTVESVCPACRQPVESKGAVIY